MKSRDIGKREELAELFALSAEVLTWFQKHRPRLTPSDATAVMMIALGRLIAREGFETLDRESYWKAVQSLQELCQYGFDQQRGFGSKGLPVD